MLYLYLLLPLLLINGVYNILFQGKNVNWNILLGDIIYRTLFGFVFTIVVYFSWYFLYTHLS
jgi:predicted permease